MLLMALQKDSTPHIAASGGKVPAFLPALPARVLLSAHLKGGTRFLGVVYVLRFYTSQHLFCLLFCIFSIWGVCS